MLKGTLQGSHVQNGDHTTATVWSSPAAVLLEQPERVGVSEVLELHEAVGSKAAHNGIHELVQKLVVLLAAHALVPQPDVQRVFQHRRRVRAHV